MLKYVLYLVIYFFIYLMKPSSCIDELEGGNSTNSRRLHHSVHVDISEYPYVVSVLRHGRHWCGGALITSQLVITTANCVWRRNSKDQMSIRLGSTKPRSGGQQMFIKEIIRHPYWNISTDPNCDIAVIKMEEKVKFSKTLHPADIPNVNMLPKYNDVWVTGYGTERADGIFPSDEVRLQVYHAELVNQTVCRNIVQKYHVQLSNTFFCLSQVDERAPCTRDTGAPAVSHGVVWGLASWGIRRRCGTKTLPAMFTYLGAPENVEFIKAMSVQYQVEDATPAPWFYE